MKTKFSRKDVVSQVQLKGRTKEGECEIEGLNSYEQVMKDRSVDSPWISLTVSSAAVSDIPPQKKKKKVVHSNQVRLIPVRVLSMI